MRGLFWKIFLWVWATMILIVVATALYSNYFLPVERIGRGEARELVNFYANATASIYNSGGEKAVSHWLSNLKPPVTMKIRVRDNSNGTTIAKSKLGKIPEKYWQTGPVFRIPIWTADGHMLRFIAVFPTTRAELQQKRLYQNIVRIIFAFLIIGIICYLLSLYLTKPLRKLQSAASAIAAGKLSTRVAEKIGSRNDAISELATEFDRMAEKIESVMNAQRSLLQNVSHELRSPLSRLQVSLDLARRNSNSKIDNELDRIELEAEKLNDLIGEILSFSRLQNLEKPNIENIDLIALIKEIIHTVDYEFSQLALPIKLNTNIETYPLKADKKLLARAIENILRNAYRFNPTDKPIEISITQENHHITITIRDHGPGVDDEELEQLFKPFFRGHKSQGTEGYGLGLAISQQAIRLHKGTISASNTHNAGLEVLITL